MITSLQNPRALLRQLLCFSLGKATHYKHTEAFFLEKQVNSGTWSPPVEVARFVQVSGENRPLGLRGEKQRPYHRPGLWSRGRRGAQTRPLVLGRRGAQTQPLVPGRRGAGRRHPGDTYRCAHGCSHARMRESTHAHTYTDAHIHMCSHLHRCTHPLAHTCTHIHRCTHSRAHTYTDAHIHTHSHAHTYTDAHIHTLTRAHTYTMHTSTHAHTCTHLHGYTHAHTCTHIHRCTHPHMHTPT